MSGPIGELAKGSIQGLPPRAVSEMLKNGYDATNYLDNRGKAEFLAIQNIEEEKRLGCVGHILTLPGIREIRGVLPSTVKNFVKGVLGGYVIEP